MHCGTPRTTEGYGSVGAPNEALSERHLRELRDGSGIPLEIIGERSYTTVVSAAELRALGFADYQARVPALLIPIHGVDGSNDRYVLKPDHPRLEHRPDKPDRPIKYEYPAGQPNVLDVPLRCKPSLPDPTVDLWITEGWKKADALAGIGKCVLALGGVWNWCHRDAEGKSGVPIDDWQPILPSLNGRRIFICYDSDAVSNPSVGLAERRLANFLRIHGAWVFIVRLPSEPDGSKNGVDDFIVRRGAAALNDLVDVAVDSSSDAVRALRARVRELEQQLSAQAAVLRNAELSATQKVVAIATVHEASWAASAGKSTPYKVNYQRLAEAAGVSAQSVSSAIKVLSEPSGGLFVQHHTREVTDDGQWRSCVRLTPRIDGNVVELLKATAEYTPPERPAWGGKRGPCCPDHPLADVKKRRILACADCGQVIDDTTITLNCHLDISDVEQFEDLYEPGADPGLPLKSQDDISDTDGPFTVVGSPPVRTMGGQADSSAGRHLCLVCSQSLFPDELAACICEHCARSVSRSV
jgi:Domain of unknown function (DUF3854)